MIWHIVRFDFDGLEADVREDVEARLEALADIDEVAWLRLGRDVDAPHVTGLLTGFATMEDLVTYRTHPDHLPVVNDIRDLGIPLTRVDVETPDDVGALPG